MPSIIIKNVLINDKRQDICVKDNVIAKIGDCAGMQAETVLDGSRMAAIPGFVNMHTHSGMTLFRGMGEDMPLAKWLEEIWKAEAHLDDELIYWATKLACLEMIHTGTTTFNDMYWRLPHAAKAVKESGIRATLCYTILDGGDKAKQELQRAECEQIFYESKDWGDRVRFAPAIHAHYTVCDENMLWATDFARRHGLILHTHLAETEPEERQHMEKYGISSTRRLYNMGILGENTVAAHVVWVSAEDIRLLGEKKVTAVHNINSNLKLSSGYRFPYNELRDAGVNVTVGTDGCGSSNNLDMLEALKTSAIVQKAWRGVPTAMPLDELLAMGTVNGAKALGVNAGEIREGALADICLVDMNNTFFAPNYNFKSNLVYSAHSSCIDTVICDGRILMQGGKVEGEQEILDEFSKQIKRFQGLISHIM